MARVLFVSFDEIPTFKGACTHILSSFRHLHKTWEITLISLGVNPLPLSSGIRHLCFSIEEKNYLRRVEEFRNRLRQHLQVERYDLAHFRSSWEGSVVMDFNIPSIFEVNALASIELAETYGDLSDSLLSKIKDLEQECLQKAKLVVCPSPRTSDFLQSIFGVPQNKIRILPNGYDLLRRPRTPVNRGTVRLAYVGTLHPWQGLLWSLRSFIGLPLELHIFSPHHNVWTRRLHKRILKYDLKDKVIVHEPMPKFLLQRKLAEFDLGFSPLLKVPRNTIQGCCPVKNLEYLASGLPVLASDLFVNRQFLIDRENSLLFAASTRASLKNHLIEIIANPESLVDLAAAAQSSLSKAISWNQYSELLGSIYQKIWMDVKNSPPVPSNKNAAHFLDDNDFQS